MSSRNTNQKKIILDTLSSLRNHPTIYELYEKVKDKDSNIGVATVYRNIKKFVNDGTVFVVKTQSGIDRYDYFGNHFHFECLSCGNIIDLYDDQLQEKIKTKVTENNLEFVNCSVMINGYCKYCQKDNKNNNEHI